MLRVYTQHRLGAAIEPDYVSLGCKPQNKEELFSIRFPCRAYLPWHLQSLDYSKP